MHLTGHVHPAMHLSYFHFRTYQSEHLPLHPWKLRKDEKFEEENIIHGHIYISKGFMPEIEKR